MSAITAPPAADEVEVSLFGPGTGESSAVHLGDGRWIIVDSCIDRKSRKNAAMTYLDNLGVASSSVELLIATHAHDDHIAGLADLVDRYDQASLAIPSAASVEDYWALYELDKEFASVVRPRAFKEYDRAFEILRSRATVDPPKIELALSGRDLPLNGGQTSSAGSQIRVRCLSPSSTATYLATQVIARTLARAAGTEIQRVLPRDPNTLCAAVLIEVGNTSVVLGGDLLKGPGDRCGWRGVLTDGIMNGTVASLYKVPHHGSPTGDLEEFWVSHVSPDGLALLAPYRGSKRPSPQDEDIERIRPRVSEVITTAETRLPAAGKELKRLASALGTTARSVRDLDGTAGHIRARATAGTEPTDWAVDLVRPARQR